MKKIFLVASAILLIAVACKDKKQPAEPEPVSQENEISEPAEPDTVAQEDTITEPPPEPDKYFLIAGSFERLNNAETFQKEMAGKGFKSEVITRNWGPNREYYKVSYMGFKDKQEAISHMKEERNKEGRDSVWVLVKK